mmetsp:Transcript_60138/g.137911  ORF Transcript_60138/g.137911 Transcript_60138/m.137911 type:complete len:205 (-) Transcript_60138:38-652(-)
MDELSALGVTYDVLAPDFQLRKLLQNARARVPSPSKQPPSPPPTSSHQHNAASQSHSPPPAGSPAPEAAQSEGRIAAFCDEPARSPDDFEDGQRRVFQLVGTAASVAKSVLGLTDDAVRAAAARVDVGGVSAKLIRDGKARRAPTQPRIKAGVLVGCLCALRFGPLRAAIGALAILLAWDLSLGAMRAVRRGAHCARRDDSNAQ